MTKEAWDAFPSEKMRFILIVSYSRDIALFHDSHCVTTVLDMASADLINFK